MKKIVTLLFVASILVCCNQKETNFFETKDAYFGLTPPGLTPEVFAPDIVSDTSWREHCQLAISPKGDEIYWSKFSKDTPEKIYFSQFRNGTWTNPSMMDFMKDDSTLTYGSPTFSPDDEKLFFYSKDRSGGLGYIDAWYVERTNNGWSEHITVGKPFNTEGDDRPPIITEKGHAYTMGRNFEEDKVNFLRFKYTEGVFSHPTTVSIYKDNPSWWPLYVSPDESYIIFPSAMKEGFGRLDLYVCFKEENDTWGEPINLGPEVNTKLSERFPVVSPDGKYLFFMRHTETWDIFWVSIDIINKIN